MARDSCRKSDTDSNVANRWTAVTSHLSFSSNHTKDDGKPQTRLGVAKPKSYDGLETVTVQHIEETRDGTLTEWLTPHITTLSRGSLARNSFTFWATKCFFLVLVLLAIDAAMLLAEAIFR